jgi:hypothetical protein
MTTLKDKYRKPRVPFCWVCSRKLNAGIVHVVCIVGAREVITHKACAEREGLWVKPDAHKPEAAR